MVAEKCLEVVVTLVTYFLVMLNKFQAVATWFYPVLRGNAISFEPVIFPFCTPPGN